MTFTLEGLYLQDSYIKEYETKIISIEENKIILEKTIFYPMGGGQPSDKGILQSKDEILNIVEVKKIDGEIIHIVHKKPEIIKENEIINCKLDWERRHTLMRYHTATHILCSVFNKYAGALITGNQIDVDKTRIDFDLENFDREKITYYSDLANQIISRNIDIEIFFMNRDKAMKIEGITKLAKALPPSIEKLRIVKIGDFDMQADGGTHVKNTSEIGKIEIIKAENKGKNNRRVYFKLD
jgi:misacylated tRNA(Ala) deacylase